MIEYGKDWKYPIEEQHTITGPKIFGKDIDLVRRMMFESSVSVGTTVEYFRCNKEIRDFNQDPDGEWDTGIKLNAIFEDNPKVSVLKNLGWYNEDEEIRPPIIYLPIYKNWESKDILDITDNSLIRVHYFGQIEPSEFRITDKKMDSVYGVYWVCKLAPERLDNFVEVTDNGSRFLKRREDRSDSCIHRENEVESDVRTYEHEDYENYIEKSDKKSSKDDNNDDYSSLIMEGI